MRAFILFLSLLGADDPAILTVQDVSADGGGRVEIEFASSGLDSPGSPAPISEYELHRRIDAPLRRSGGWEIVGTVAATGASAYSNVVSTVADSSASGLRWTVFFVRAVGGPGVFFDSPPDSGYSVDNPPGRPLELVLDETGFLFWDASFEPDFRSFRVYAAEEQSFDERVQFVVETPLNTYDVRELRYPWYFVTATDAAGQEGPPALAASSLEQVPVTGDGRPPVFVTPHPFRSAAVISYRIPTAGPVTIGVYDALGRRLETLVEGEWHAAERHELPWRPTSAMGMFVIRVEAPGFDEAKKVVRLR